MNRATSAIAMAFALLLVGCSGPSHTHSDPDGLVGFALPDGWAERSQSNGIRFGRADAPDARTVLAVSASARDPAHDLAAQRELRQSQIRATGQELRIDEIFELKAAR